MLSLDEHWNEFLDDDEQLTEEMIPVQFDRAHL